MDIFRFPEIRKGTVDYLRSENLYRLLLELLLHEGQTKNGLVQSTGLSMTTVSECINWLTRAEFLNMVGKEVSSGGRRPVCYSIRRDYAVLAGVQLRAENAEITWCDLQNSILDQACMPLTPSGPEEILTQIVQAVRERLDGRRLAAVGLGIGGAVKPFDGVVLSSPELGWTDVRVKEILQKRLGVPVYLDHTVKCACQYQQMFGAAVEYSNYAVYMKQYPELAAVVVNGQVLYGENGKAGQVRSLDELVACLGMLDAHVLITDAEVTDSRMAVLRPSGDWEHVSRACALMAEVRWFSEVYELTKADQPSENGREP